MANFEFRFSGPMAKKYGTDEAVILYNIAYWVSKNTANGKNIHDGRVWTYNTQKAFSEIFDIWSPRQIQRILRNLETKGAIIKGNYNAKRMDRTLWYTISDEVMEFYGIQPPGTEADECSDQMVECMTPNRVMDNTVSSHAKHQSVSPIPDNKPDIKPNRTPSGGRVNQEAQFQAFWTKYPRKEGRKNALAKWKRLNPDPELFASIMAGLDRALRSEQWRRGVIPHPTTWLNGERWEDELTPPTRRLPDREPGRIDPGEGCEYV